MIFKLRQNATQSKLPKWLQKFGILAFIGFFVKGMLWLIVPVLVAQGFVSCDAFNPTDAADTGLHSQTSATISKKENTR